MHIELDDIERRLIGVLRRHPRKGVSEMARLMGFSRATVRDRLRRLEAAKVIRGYGPDIEPRSVGLGVSAFVIVTIAQGGYETATGKLGSVAEVLEIHTVTGRGDLLLRLAATTNDHLHEAIQRIAAVDEVRRTETLLALHSAVTRTVADLVVDEIDRWKARDGSR